ncbi:hypothetical protein H9S92_03265 [Lewinella lacunae]|uniref:Uncharacterized protein n=1 Tax=Neolewinella lacunae TaxID=1517758 RepID=A0A923PK38_9BACT|nr:hypothetical protein [Neolewinella lacunae]MBC6993166.1 hypothetical protein [Neolewinella lacunae]
MAGVEGILPPQFFPIHGFADQIRWATAVKTTTLGIDYAGIIEEQQLADFTPEGFSKVAPLGHFRAIDSVDGKLKSITVDLPDNRKLPSGIAGYRVDGTTVGGKERMIHTILQHSSGFIEVIKRKILLARGWPVGNS